MSSRFVLHCQKIMRLEMHRFIAHEVDMTYAAPLLFGSGDLGTCKEILHVGASHMDLSMEMEHLSTRLVIFKVQQASKRHSDFVCRVVDKWPLNVPNLYRSVSLDYISILDDQNGTFLYLPLTNEMRTHLHSRLIEAAKPGAASGARRFLETQSREFRMIQNDFSKLIDLNRPANWKVEHACLREIFLTRVGLQAPQLLRVIDIEATCMQRERVVLIDYQDDGVQQMGYTAISHTYGLPVYEVFDCRCASECSTKVRPRSLDKPCPHEHKDASSVGAGSETHKSVVNDILRMCDILRKAGVNYAWHDGVCIAQHDESEVKETIKHMGWIYANAKETIIFLHYVGNPMAPIRMSNAFDELGCRWHTRVWTLQEAALSKCRRYCVRVGSSPLGDCWSLEEFEDKIELWYGDESSTIEIIEEETFFEFVKEIHRVLCFLSENMVKRIISTMPNDADNDVIAQSMWTLTKVSRWNDCIMGLLETLLSTCFQFPSVQTAIVRCGSRKSKHLGDYINSILALAEVKDFVAPKDVNLEASTIDFFKKQGQRGLAMAVFSINNCFKYDDIEYISKKRRQTWPPVFGSPLLLCDRRYDCIGFEVLQDGRMELRAELVCVKVQFTAKLFHKDKDVEYISGMYDNALEVSDDLSYLDMDLTVYQMPSKFGAKLSENSVGLTMRQLPGTNSSVSDIIMGSAVYISAIKKCTCNYSHRPALAKEIQDGDIIHTHLVIPATMTNPTILIVQGSSLQDAPHVSKVGIFKPSKAFIELVSLILHLPAVTTIHKLVIM